MRKKVAILGSTGSIGKQTLQVIRRYPELFQVEILSANKNIELLEKQIIEFVPKVAFVNNSVNKKINNTIIYNSLDALALEETYDNIDIVINGIVGLSGLPPTIAILKSKAALATANKESIVCAGKFINRIVKENNSIILPVDSEHSTIFQCIGENKDNVSGIILTASGGAFRDYDIDEISSFKAKRALLHPTWKMGVKVTIDSATMMNKGMEIIEAKHLFNIDNIEVIGHKESIVHSMVTMKDSSIIAGLSNPDMTLPIQYALTYPERMPSAVNPLNFAQIKSLQFFDLDLDKYPCLKIAKEIMRERLDNAVIMNSANEILVDAYLKDRIKFYDIPLYIEKALNHFYNIKVDCLEDIYRIDSEVSEYTIKQLG